MLSVAGILPGTPTAGPLCTCCDEDDLRQSNFTGYADYRV